ncbi:MAG: DUF4388 domain-containing protein [Thermoanaerobaculia bacterium]
MTDRKFEYRGDLGVTPLPEILATIHRYRVPGVVIATREARVRHIALDEGVVVFASSNEKEVSLGMLLLRRGILTPKLAREADERRTRDGLRLGNVLLQMGILTPEDLNRAVADQVREILWGAFDWDSGEVVFEIGERAAGRAVRLDLPIPEAILEGIRRSADVRRLVQRLGHAQTILERQPSTLLDLFSASERGFFDKVDGRTPLQKLCAKGPGTVTENARLLYAFYCLGLLRKRRGSGDTGLKKIQYKTEGGSLGN